MAVKKFYNTTTATLNAAPLVRYYTQPLLSDFSEDIYLPQQSCAKVVVSCGEQQSDERFYTTASMKCEYPMLMSSMAIRRAISRGEVDTLLWRVTPNTEAEVVLNCCDFAGEETQWSTSIMSDERGVVEFCFNCDNLASDTNMVQVHLKCEGRVIETLIYVIIPKGYGACRLAWISSYGAIEHYTFAKTSQKSHTSDGSTIKSIISAYESRDMVEAIAEIISSPAVWVHDVGGYKRVNVLTDELVTYRDGIMTLVELKIEEYV
ncbi:MAG: hypothetical protein SNH80_04875 [Rikenellaceae bacterium]